MKRIITAICFVVFLITLAITSNLYLYFSVNNLCDIFDKSYEYAIKNDVESAKVEVQNAIEQYEKNEKLYVMIIRTTPLETITEKLYSLETYLNFGEIAHFCAENRKVRSLVNHLWQSEKPTINNVV